MNTTIYIRKENEERWNQITDKSAWVNAYLAKSPPNPIVIKEKLEPLAVPVEATPRDIVEMVPVKEGFQFCKHNAVKGMCKLGCK